MTSIQPVSNDWMQTFTGKAFFPLAVNVEDIDEFDIAHSLAMQCRYNGHVSQFYSVAEHCVHMSYIVPEQDALWALLHDATEAYVGDMVRPLKKNIPIFSEIEDKIMEAVCEKFELHQNFMPDSVKEADNRIIENERLALLREPPYPWTIHGDPYPDVEIQAWDPATAEFKYYTRLQELLFDREVREAKKLAEMAQERNG